MRRQSVRQSFTACIDYTRVRLKMARAAGSAGIRHLTQLLEYVPERLAEEDELRELDGAAPKITDVKPVSASARL